MTAFQTSITFEQEFVDTTQLIHGDAFDWLEDAEPNSIHAVVTDPPYGLLEYTPHQLEKMRNGRGGVWRLPPSFDNAIRKPVPDSLS